MMKEFSFYTDGDLRLCPHCAGRDPRECGHPAGSREKKYDEVLPRIVVNDRDALAEAVAGKKSILLEGRSFPFLCAHVKADITIAPVAEGPGGSISGVRVSVKPQEHCAVARKLNDSQGLIDLGKMASTLAHGVRNPLNAIKGAVVYLGEKYDQEAPLVEFTRIIEEEISRLEGFISRFLSSSLSDTDLALTDVNDLLHKVEVLTSLQLYTRGVRSVFSPGNVPPVMVNAFHLEQAVLNVTNNAIEAMEPGGTLTVSTDTAIQAGGASVVIVVSDTGPGMAAPPLEVPVNRTRERAGRGFGLFIAYEILKYYNGRLEIHSRKDKGTTVKLYVPAAQPAGSA